MMLTDGAAGAAERSEAGRRRSTAKRVRPTVSREIITEPTWSERLTAPLSAVTGPTRQVWLATLGSAAITVQGAAFVWGRLVAEGAIVERALRDRTQWAQRLVRFTTPNKRRG
jgi:hypothetical protein